MKVVSYSPGALMLAIFRLIVHRFIQGLRSEIAEFRQQIEELRKEPPNLTSDDADSTADRLVRVLGLAFAGRASRYTELFEEALKEACRTAPETGFPLGDLPRRVNYNSLREAGVSESEIATLHKRLTRVCARHKRFYGRWREEKALKADAKRRFNYPYMNIAWAVVRRGLLFVFLAYFAIAALCAGISAL